MARGKGSPVLAVDIGGTKTLLGIFSRQGMLAATGSLPTLAQEGVEAVIARLCRGIEDFLGDNNLKPAELGGIGIACAGGVDSQRGVVVTPSPNMPGWENIPLAEIIRERFGVATYLVNDASAAALGEHRCGAGRGAAKLVMFTVGTGIGGGIIIAGRLYLGAVGGAGELGHMTVAADGAKCGCGNTGCLELFASGRAVAQDAIRRLQAGQRSILPDMVSGDIGRITAVEIGMAARKGDALAQEVISRAAYYLGVGMVNVTNIFNPELIIIGGGMAALGEMLVAPGRRLVAERAFPISSRAVRITSAALGNEAGIYGAAYLVLERGG